MHTDKAALTAISGKVIGCALVVLNTLGVGFLEKVYENALAHELRKAGLAVEQQHGVLVHYDGVIVGAYAADLLVENAVLVELKAVGALDGVHQAQCMNYLKATGATALFVVEFRSSSAGDQTVGQRVKVRLAGGASSGGAGRGGWGAGLLGWCRLVLLGRGLLLRGVFG